MAAATLAPDKFVPQPPGGMGQGALLALIAHAGLLAALTVGVHWKSAPPDIVSAELWAPLPAPAPPREEAPVPAPAPDPIPKQPEPALPDPQIAVEKAKREKAERERAEQERLDRERKLQAEREKTEREAKAAEERLARQREENLRRMMGQIGAAGSAPAATAAEAAPSRSYAGKLVAHIKPNIVFTDTISGNPAAEVEVRAAPSGTILSRRLAKSSGHKEWDEAVLRAIDRTGVLPRDVDGRVPPTILVAFRPQE
jgi:colicin import membrane protein